VQKFVDAWNDIVEYIKDNNLVTRDETDSQNPTNVFGVLAKTSIDDDALSAMRSTLSTTKYTSGSRVRILADLGIQTQQDGTLKFKIDGASSEVTFKEALAEEPNSVNELLKSFADTMSKTGGTIGLYTGFGRGFSLTINNNEEQITELNRRISDIEGRIAKTEQSMRSRFASLESNIGRLQQQQSALNSALGGLR
jgi:flagellar hook-associated protein 2